MRNVFQGKAFQAFGGAKPIQGQKVGGPVPVVQRGMAQPRAVSGASPAPRIAPAAPKTETPGKMPGKSNFSGDCPVCH